MRTFSTLSAKILFWSFLNLALVAGVFVIFFTVRFQHDFQGFFGRQARDRLRTASRIISHELERAPKSEWSKILARHSEIYQVDLAVAAQGELIKPSENFFTPTEVADAVKDALSFKLHHLRKKLRSRNLDQNRPVNRERIPRLILRSKNPTRYWAGVFMPLAIDPHRRPQKTILLASSDSLTGHGFFFDPLPWIIAACMVAGFSVLFWTPLIRHITKPLKRMTQASEKIALGRFDVRIEENRKDEIGRLGRAINHMTSRLAGHVKGQKRFLGDIAHELGSPIARIQFGLGALEQRCNEENRERVRGIQEDAAHMSNLVNELLSFSRAEISPDKVKPELVELEPIVCQARDREIRPGVQIHIHVPPKIMVFADGKLLTRAVSNLLRNAVRYAGSDGPIEVEAKNEKNEVRIEVRDCGPGAADDLLDQLFEPFYRPEPSRNRRSGGVGLGLAIVKTCVEACKGSVAAKNLSPSGFAVLIRLSKKPKTKKGAGKKEGRE